MEYWETIKQLLIFLLAVLLVCALVFGGCVLGCRIYWCNLNLDLDFGQHSYSNTRDEAAELVHGETQKIELHIGDNYWYYFDLEAAENVAVTYTDINDFSAYLYAETDKMPAPLPDADTDASENGNAGPADGQNAAHGALDPATFDETKRIGGNGFETFDLAAGRYYVHLHAVNGHMFGMANTSILFMITGSLPELATDGETTVYAGDSGAQPVNYLRFDPTEKIELTLRVDKPRGMAIYVDFHYGEGNKLNSRMYFGRADEAAEEPATCTLPAGFTIVHISCSVSQDQDGIRSDATIAFTAAPAPDDDTLDENEFVRLTALPQDRELSLGREGAEVPSCMTVYGLRLPAESVVSVRLRNKPPFMSAVVSFNYGARYAVRGSVGFLAADDIADERKTYTLPAGRCRIEIYVYVGPQVKPDAAAIEFTVSPAVV